MNDTIKNAIESLEEYKKSLLKLITTTIQATNSNDDYSIGLRNGLRICKLYVDGLEPEYEKCKPSTKPNKSAPKTHREQINLECEFCRCHECGDTLYESSDWDGGIGFDYIRNIKYCPICGRMLFDEERFDQQVSCDSSCGADMRSK